MGWEWRGPVALATLATVLSTTGPASAGALPTPLPSTAAQLAAEARRQAGVLADEQLAQQQADARAVEALQAYQTARREAEQAARTAQTEGAALRAAEGRTASSREALSRYLGSVYRSGVGTSDLSVLNDLIEAEDPQALFSGLSIASRVGGNRSDQLAALRTAQDAQTRAAVRARAAQERARTTARQAEAAKAKSDQAVADQQARVAAAAARLAAAQQSAAAAGAREAALAKAETIARTRSAAPLAAVLGAAVARPEAGCSGSSTAGFPNGQIPSEVLCPLWGTSDQMLRADAAAAFNAMSRKYAETFSAPVCVTDSYRSHGEQVAVRASKPALAAVPGTSNHGWGVAVDLCDGVQTFGTPQHRWLQQNAMAFGWFHPSWAQVGGSKPEAWHWEYAG